MVVDIRASGPHGANSLSSGGRRRIARIARIPQATDSTVPPYSGQRRVLGFRHLPGNPADGPMRGADDTVRQQHSAALFSAVYSVHWEHVSTGTFDGVRSPKVGRALPWVKGQDRGAVPNFEWDGHEEEEQEQEQEQEIDYLLFAMLFSTVLLRTVYTPPLQGQRLRSESQVSHSFIHSFSRVQIVSSLAPCHK
jgi:hypothetical protein